jgi:hypothetical protein
MTDTTLSTVDAANAARVSVRQLHLWTDAGYLHPTTTEGAGGQGGKANRWTPGDVERAEQLGVFARTICGPHALSFVAKGLEHDGPSFAMLDGVYAVIVEIRVVTSDPPDDALPSAGNVIAHPSFDMHRYFKDKATGRQ